MTRLHWSSWSGTALGTGQFYDGGRLYPVALTASRVAHGHYSALKYSFSQRVPAGFPRAWTITYDGHNWHGHVV